MIVAVSGIKTLRNTAIKIRKLTMSTLARNSGRLREMIVLASSKLAVCPPTSTCRPDPRSAAGITRLRTAWSRSLVAALCGEPVR